MAHHSYFNFLYLGKFILSLNRGVTKSGGTKSGSDCTDLNQYILLGGFMCNPDLPRFCQSIGLTQFSLLSRSVRELWSKHWPDSLEYVTIRGCQANALTTVLARSAREARIGSGQCSDRIEEAYHSTSITRARYSIYPVRPML
eukprot:sb/3474068/